MAIKDKDTLRGDLVTSYTDNTSGDITALTVRNQQTDVIDSLVHVDHLSEVAEPNPHDQYALETAVLDNFVGAGYGGLISNGTYALPNISGGAWSSYLEWDAVSLTAPRYVTQDLANNGLVFTRPGIWQLNVKITVGHNALNTGRTIKLRFYNSTTATPGVSEFVYGVGRESEATNLFVVGALFEITDISAGDVLQLQFGSDDSFTSVQSLGGSYEAVHISEFQDLGSYGVNMD